MPQDSQISFFLFFIYLSFTTIRTEVLETFQNMVRM